MPVLMLFLDGVGIGNADAATNPFFAASLPNLRSLLANRLPTLNAPSISTTAATLFPLDATLGVEGLPQSGTGQTALFTGINGARMIGKHFGPHPYSSLKPVIERNSIFRQLLNIQRTPCFANAFPQRFFDYIDRKRARLTVTTYACLTSGVKLKDAVELAGGRAVSADITSAAWPRMGYPHISEIPPQEAGRRLVRLLDDHDFVLFEYWQTDHAGHAMEMPSAVDALERFDGMVGGIMEHLDEVSSLVLLTSDHGNIEDLSVKTHTRNPVPALCFGWRHREFSEMVLAQGSPPDLTHILPVLMDFIVS